MLKIGLTGGIGCGKSTVSRMFAELSVPVIDADTIAHDIVKPGEPALKLLAEHFGDAIITDAGTLDRRALREKVFQDETKREQLEALLHPLIRRRIHTELAALCAPYVILAIPLLLEKHWENEVDRILVVDTPESLQLSRTMARDHSNAETIQRIMQTQVSRQQRIAAADDIIHNDGDRTVLRQQVITLHRRYNEMAVS